jgi:membrane protease YdiL (CAAX protease family)
MSLSDFGLRLPSWRYGGIALAISIPLSALAQVAVMRVHEAGPLAGLSLPLGAVCFYFLLCAPVQEEFIFRGLVQSIFAKEVSTVSASAWPGVLAGCTAAILFGLVHLVVGPATAAAALVLGFVAGELRRQSGSLLPAILSHAIFNLPGIFFG